MKRILFLITTLNCGGAEKALVDMVNSLPSDRYETTVQTIINTGVYSINLNNNIKYKSIINKHNSIFGWIKLRLIYHIFSPIYIYNKYIKDNYDIEIAFLEGLCTRIISYSTNQFSKKYAWVHTDLVDYFRSNKDFKSFEENKECYKKFDKIVCVSGAVKEKFIERFGNFDNKFKVIYNIVDDKDISKKGEEPIGVYNHDYPILVSCGRLTNQKGFDRLLHIHKKLLFDGIKNYLWIIGEGGLRKQFEDYIMSNRLENTVILWGFQTNPYKIIKKADLFVCSSIAEGYSTVVTESVLLGIPVVSTDVAGAKEPLDFPRCYKVVKNDENSLYNSIKNVLNNKNEMQKMRDYTIKISKYFTKEKYLDELLKFLGE